MWKLLAAEKDDAGAANSVDHLTRVPVVLRILLLAGGGATVGSSCLLGNDNKWLHYCQVLALTFVARDSGAMERR